MRTTIVYLLCFDSPIGTIGRGAAQHYLGSSADLRAELSRHSGRSHAAIMREVNRRGIGWQLVRTWPGGRGEERRIKNQGSHARVCPVHATVWRYELEDKVIGGYSAVAAEINKRFAPQPPMDRRQVYRWFTAQSRNHDGQLPPRPAAVHNDAARTTPRYLFDTEQWVAWYRAGTRGPNGKGWLVRAEITPGTKDMPVAAGIL
jgi:hypothetical protein